MRRTVRQALSVETLMREGSSQLRIALWMTHGSTDGVSEGSAVKDDECKAANERNK